MQQFSFPVKDFQNALLAWFKHSGRKDLPWQIEPTPYRIWVSEIMLQQTQVTTVIPYYERFMQRFPDIQTLAKSASDEVLHYWTGLGYYARARHLHKTAQIICTDYRGVFPKKFEQLIELPGIGRSTAGAILAFSTGQSMPILDGNVKRVLSRLFAYSNPHPKTQEDHLWTLATLLTPKKKTADYTQAIMDLGATLCTRSQPNCSHCPVQSFCKAKKQNKVAHFPKRKVTKQKPKQAVRWLLLLSSTPALLLVKRDSKLWGGLWGPLECSLELDPIAWCKNYLSFPIKHVNNLETFRHTFTHFHLDIHPVIAKVNTRKKTVLPPHMQWYPLEGKIPTIGMAAPVKRLIHLLANEISETR